MTNPYRPEPSAPEPEPHVWWPLISAILVSTLGIVLLWWPFGVGCPPATLLGMLAVAEGGRRFRDYGTASLAHRLWREKYGLHPVVDPCIYDVDHVGECDRGNPGCPKTHYPDPTLDSACIEAEHALHLQPVKMHGAMLVPAATEFAGIPLSVLKRLHTELSHLRAHVRDTALQDAFNIAIGRIAVRIKTLEPQVDQALDAMNAYLETIK